MKETKNGRTQGKKTNQSKPEPQMENESLTAPEASPLDQKSSEIPESTSKPQSLSAQPIQTESDEALPHLLKGGRAPRIALDPGHGMGGGDNGAVGPTGGSEENVALAVGKLAAEFLGSVGVEVLLTRKDDVATALSSRVEAARKAKVDAFVSIHCNAVDNPNAEGIETLYPAPGGQSKALANVVHQSILKAAGKGHRDRGLKMSPSPEYPRRLYVLSNAAWPAVLLELEFISHPAHEKWLLQSDTQKSLAFAIARGVLQWLKAQPDVAEHSPQQRLT